MTSKLEKIVITALLATTFQQSYAADDSADKKITDMLEEVKVKDKQDSRNLPKPYAGGQVARGAQIGVLGNKDMMDVPFSFSSFTAKTIQDQQARTLGDVLINDSSVRTGQAFGTAAQTFVIRGFTLGSEDVGFNGLYGLLPRQLPALDNIERVDLLKGASAFLNGVPPSGSGIGGSVNLVPKRAEATPTATATADYQNNGQLGGHMDIGGRFGSNQKFGVRLNATQREGDMSVSDEHNRLTYIALGADFKGERARLSSDIGYQKQNISRPRLAVTMSGTGVPNAPDANINYGQPWSYTQVESTYAAFRGDYDLTDNLTVYAGGGASHNNEFTNGVSYSVTNNGVATGSRLASVYNTEAVTAQAGLRGKAMTGAVTHEFNLAVSAVNTTARSDYLFNSAPLVTSIYDPVSYDEPQGGFSSGSLFNPSVTNRVHNKSMALSDTLGFFADQLQMTLGVRHQSIHVINYDFVSGQKSDDSDKSITTPIYGALYKVNSMLSVYANHIEGLSQGPVAPSTAANFGQALSPLRSQQEEVGFKVDMGKVGASVALFQIKSPSTYTDLVTNVFSKNGEQRNRGLELNVFGEPMDGWRVLGGATFMDAALTKTSGGTNNGNSAIGVPKSQYNLYTEYDISKVPGLVVNGRWVQSGMQYVNASNTLSIPGWQRFDLGVRYQTQLSQHKATFRANLENVFNENYWAAVSPTFSQVTMGLPRTFKLSGTIDF